MGGQKKSLSESGIENGCRGWRASSCPIAQGICTHYGETSAAGHLQQSMVLGQGPESRGSPSPESFLLTGLQLAFTAGPSDLHSSLSRCPREGCHQLCPPYCLLVKLLPQKAGDAGSEEDFVGIEALGRRSFWVETAASG